MLTPWQALACSGPREDFGSRGGPSRVGTCEPGEPIKMVNGMLDGETKKNSQRKSWHACRRQSPIAGSIPGAQHHSAPGTAGGKFLARRCLGVSGICIQW